MSRGGKNGNARFEKKSVDELIVEYKKMIQTGKLFASFASDNLKHWLGNTGDKRIVGPDSFQNDSAVINHLKRKHRGIFLSQQDRSKGLIPRIRKNPGAARYSMNWEDSTYATRLSELFFALGGFTLRSKVEVSVKPDSKDANLYHVTFESWQSQAFDEYNWDHGKSVHIPGWGRIDDKDALRVERAGKAKSFDVESRWWTVSRPSITGPAKIQI